MLIIAKHKIASLLLKIGDRAISSKFSTNRVLSNTLHRLLKKFLKMTAKTGKRQNCFYLLNHSRREISSKFSSTRMSKQYTILTFDKFSNSGHFEFSNFCQKWRSTNLLLTILSKFLMYRVSKQYNLPNCQNNFALVINMSYLEFFVIFMPIIICIKVLHAL